MCGAGTWTVRGAGLAVQCIIKTVTCFVSLFIIMVGDLGFCEFYSFLSISYKCVNWYLELQFTIFIRMLNFCAAAYILKVCSESFEL